MTGIDPQLTEWFAEFQRLAAEAAERFDAGELRPAMASLAAVTMVHQMLLNECGELTARPSGPADQHYGTYL